jgi:hypothetical protein
MQYFDLSQDPYEANALTKNGNSDYQKLFKQLTWHISLSGAVPWKSPAQAARLKSGTSGNF